jgi:polar amino acid transport system substrate-binding protein
MAGKTIGTQMGSSTLDALDTDPATRDSFGELREYETFTKAMMDLDNSRLDAVVIDGIAFYGDFNVKSPGSYNVLSENFGSEEMAVGLRKKDDEWIAHINMAFDYLHASGKAAEISKKWFGEDILIIGGPRIPSSGSAGATPAGDGSWDKIRQNGKFVLGLDDEFPPMGFRDDSNEIVGFDIDMAKAAAEYLGVEVELKPVIWDTVLLSLNGGAIDCVWNGMSVTEARKKEITFSKSYVNSEQIIVTLAGSGIKTKADMAGKTVGTQMGSSTLDALDTDPATRDSFGELREYETFTKAMMDLDNGRLDAVVIDGIAFYGDFNVKAPDSYGVLADNFGSEEMAVGLRQADADWIAKINEAFEYLKSSGKAAEISKKWFGADILIL